MIYPKDHKPLFTAQDWYEAAAYIALLVMMFGSLAVLP
jgi:hypothetical protein